MKHLSVIQKEFVKKSAWMALNINIPKNKEKLTNIVYTPSNNGGPMLTLYFGRKHVPVHCSELTNGFCKDHDIEIDSRRL